MLGLKTVVLECKDIFQLLDFYSQLLEWTVVYKEDTFVRIQSRLHNRSSGVSTKI